MLSTTIRALLWCDVLHPAFLFRRCKVMRSLTKERIEMLALLYRTRLRNAFLFRPYTILTGSDLSRFSGFAVQRYTWQSVSLLSRLCFTLPSYPVHCYPGFVLHCHPIRCQVTVHTKRSLIMNLPLSPVFDFGAPGRCSHNPSMKPANSTKLHTCSAEITEERNSICNFNDHCG